jgi:Ca2+-binding EF-hand superfamily protein
MQGNDKLISMKDIKLWLPKANYKLSKGDELRQRFLRVDKESRGKVTFEEFVQFYQNLIRSCSIGKGKGWLVSRLERSMPSERTTVQLRKLNMVGYSY